MRISVKNFTAGITADAIKATAGSMGITAGITAGTFNAAGANRVTAGPFNATARLKAGPFNAAAGITAGGINAGSNRLFSTTNLGPIIKPRRSDSSIMKMGSAMTLGSRMSTLGGSNYLDMGTRHNEVGPRYKTPRRSSVVPRYSTQVSIPRYTTQCSMVRNYSTIPSKYTSPITYLKWKMNEIDNARRLYEHCSSRSLNLHLSFQSWFNTTVIHIYLVQKLLNLNNNNQVLKSFNNELLNHFYLDLEIKLFQMGVKSNIGQLIKQLVSSYQGQILGYDEGLYYGDCILMGALWRNLYSSQDSVGIQELERVLCYLKRELTRIEQVELSSVLNSTFTFEKF